MIIIRQCSACGDERSFEQPPCVEGHGEDCPELACVECGMAIIIGDAPRPAVIVRTKAA
jgi:DNA-directed RNA polymerase subunit RPC12/RpoP